MISSGNPADHLAAIDQLAWPGVAALPPLQADSWRSRSAEAAFARAAAAAGLTLDGEVPDLVVTYETLFPRLAAGGWIGLAESYMAGEWSTPTSEALVRVVEGLVEAKYRPRTPHLAPSGGGGGTPAALVSHFSGDGVSPLQGLFATGVPTTERVLARSHVPGAGRGRTPARRYMEVTELSAPLESTRLDLADAQRRSASRLLDAVHAGNGSHILFAPSPGAAVLGAALRRGATVDCATADADSADALAEQLVLAGASGDVRVLPLEDLPPRAAYDAVVSVEHLETLSDREKVRFLRGMERVLAPAGTLALQTVVATEAVTPAAEAALESLRAYVWPGLSFTTAGELARTVDRRTGLRVVAETRAPEHLAASLRLQRLTFDSHLRDAAADGFDIVYRRLWSWQFAVREALARQGMLDLAQLTLIRR